MEVHRSYADECGSETGSATFSVPVGGVTYLTPSSNDAYTDVASGLTWPTGSGSFRIDSSCGDSGTRTIGAYAPSGIGQGVEISDSNLNTTVDPATGAMHYRLSTDLSWVFNTTGSDGPNQMSSMSPPETPCLEGDLSYDATEWHATGQGFGSNSYRDRYDFILDLTMSCGASNGATATGNATPVCAPLKAVVLAPPVTRGQEATLDASQSTGDIRPKNGYRWQLTPGTGCPPGGKLAQDGVIASDDNTTTLTVRFVAVCSLTVRLTVTSANGTTDTSGPVTLSVSPRGAPFIETPITHEADDFGTHPDLPANEGFVDARYDNGLNFSSCIPEPDLRKIRVLCPREKGVTWHDYAAYDTAPVKSGPFAGWAYVSTASFHVDMVGEVQRALGPDGATPDGTDWNVYRLEHLGHRQRRSVSCVAGHDPRTRRRRGRPKARRGPHRPAP